MSKLNNYVNEVVQSDPKMGELKFLTSQMHELPYKPRRFYEIVAYKRKGKIRRGMFLFANLHNNNLYFITREDCKKYYKFYNELMPKAFSFISDVIDKTIPIAWEDQYSNFAEIKNIDV